MVLHKYNAYFQAGTSIGAKGRKSTAVSDSLTEGALSATRHAFAGVVPVPWPVFWEGFGQWLCHRGCAMLVPGS
jgi:hypothetical protein